MARRHKHNLSHQVNGTYLMGGLYPICVQEVLPGDSFNHRSSIFLRAFPTVRPLMHPTHVDVRHFFVPLRLVWNQFEQFIVGQQTDEEGDDIIWPHINLSQSTGVVAGSLSDHLGLPYVPPGDFGQDGISVSALPFRCYSLIYNEWYRDEQLGAPAIISKAGGTDTTSNIDLYSAAWRKDRFTSARTSPQLGDAVTIPIESEISADGNLQFYPEVPGGEEDPRNILLAATGSKAVQYDGDQTEGDRFARYFAGLKSSAVSLTVEEFRKSLALQRFQEQMNKTGGRYAEYLRSLGVRSSDARIDRPEYLGGGSQTISWSEVLQTSPANPSSTRGVGAYTGHGIAATRTNRYIRHFNEHGFVLSMMTIRPTTMYSQGTDRMWFRDSFEDYYQPQLQHLGMQEVYVGEVDLEHPTDHRAVFGYQDQYDDYRHRFSYRTGEMNTNFNDFDLARNFAAEPSLNEAFIECVTNDNVWQVSDNPNFFGMIRHDLRARRLVPRFAKPRTF